MFYMLFLLLLLLPTLTFGQALDRTHVAYRNPLQHGATCDATTLNAAITAIGTAKETLFITRTDRAKVNCTWTLAANITTNVNTEVYIPNGVMLSANTGITVTFNGPVVVDDPVGSLIGAGTYVFNKKLWGQPQAFEDVFSNFVNSGGIHGTSANLTSPTFATRAWLNGVEINQGAVAITYAAAVNDVCWTIISSDNDGITGWTRVGTTAYYYQCEGDTTPNQPELPANSAWLMRVTITANAITAVKSMKALSSLSARTGHMYGSDYGVVCDDSTDNVTAMRQMLLDAPQRDGGGQGRDGTVLHFGPGRCRTSGTLTISQPGITIQCAGRQSTELRYTAATGNLFTLSSSPDWTTIRDCGLISTASSTGWAVSHPTGVLRQPLIENVEVSGFLRGIQLDGALSAMLSNLKVNGQGRLVVGGIGINLRPETGGSGFNRADCMGCAMNDFEVGGDFEGAHITFRGTLETNGTGIKNRAQLVAINPWVVTGGASGNTVDFDLISSALLIGYSSSSLNVTYGNSTMRDRTIIIPEANDRVYPGGIKLGQWLIESNGRMSFYSGTEANARAEIFDTQICFGAGGASALDTCLARTSANTWTLGVSDNLVLQAGGNITLAASGGGQLVLAGDNAISFRERVAPGAPAADGALVFSRDNGAGKTQLCALFNTGVVQCFATEP